MGFDCKAGWCELQSYRAAKANKWLWRDAGASPLLGRLHVFWERKGNTDASGAAFYVNIGDQDNDSPDEARTCFEISCPSKVDGSFIFKDQDDFYELRQLVERYPVGSFPMSVWHKVAEQAIGEYERVSAPPGNAAWLLAW